MTARAWWISVGLAIVGCSRASDAPPRAVPELVVDAGDGGPAALAVPSVPSDAGPPAKFARPSPLHLVLRGPMGWQGCPVLSASYVGCAPPLLERLPGGGLVFAVEFARAVAKGPEEPLVVELLSKGLETAIHYRSVITQSPAAFRWVWSDNAASVLVDEQDYMRSGPSLGTRRLGPKGFAEPQAGVGLWSAVRRGASVLALQRRVRVIPNSSAYPKGSEYYADQTELLPARIVTVSGPGPAPVVPAGVCPRAMSAAPDGTLVVAIEACGRPFSPAAKTKVGVLRYAPNATTAPPSWVTERGDDDEMKVVDPVPAAASSGAWLAVDDTLHAWDGKAWSAEAPSKGAPIRSVSRAPDGELWIVAGDRLLRRAGGAEAWTEVPLPEAPADALDPEPWAVPSFARWAFVRVPALFGNEALRDPGASPMDAVKVDAAGDDVVVLARAAGEAFVLSTKPRRSVARVPSVSAQRAQLAAQVPREVATVKAGATSCSYAFLAFPEGTSASSLKPLLAPLRVDAGAPPPVRRPSAEQDPDEAYADESPRLAEGIVEGKSRLVVWGSRGLAPDAVKAFASFKPSHLCGAPVVAREL